MLHTNFVTEFVLFSVTGSIPAATQTKYQNAPNWIDLMYPNLATIGPQVKLENANDR